MQLFTQTPFALALAASAISSTSFAAQDIENITVTASRAELPISSLSNSISLISQDDLEQISAVHINEALARIPGTWVSRGNGQESLIAIRSPSLTGAGSCGAFLVAEDGIAARATGFCNVNQLFDINTEQAGSIEVLRGPGNEVHGSGAMHGVINVLSLAPTQEREQSLSLEGGPHDYGRIKYTYSNTEGQHGYRLNLNGNHDGGYKHDSGYDQQKMNFRHDYDGDDLDIRTLISATNLNQETAGYVSGFEAYKDSDKKKENPNPEAYRDSQSFRWQSRISQSLGNGDQLVITPYVRYADMDFAMHFLPGEPIEENGQKNVGVQLAYINQISQQLTMTTGFDSEYTDAYLKQTQDGGFSRFPDGKQYDYQVDAIVAAAFTGVNYELTPATTLNAGARLEYLEYDYNNRMLDGNTDQNGDPCLVPGGCRYTRPADRKDDFTDLSLNAGIVHELNDQHSITARVAHGFRAPQATELYRLQAGQNVADIDSEQIDSIELGLRSQYQNLAVSLTSFYMEKDNVIFQDDGRQNIDNGATEHYGLEYGIQWQIADAWDLGVNGTFARHKYTKDVTTPVPGGTVIVSTKGNDVDTAPRRMGSAQLGWQATEKSRVELEWVYMGKYYTDINNAHKYDGHDLINLRLRHEFNSTIGAGIRVTNLTDEDYAERADYNEFSQNDRYFIGEPRSVFADVTLRF